MVRVYEFLLLIILIVITAIICAWIASRPSQKKDKP